MYGSYSLVVVETRRNSSDEPTEYFDGLRLFSEEEAHLLPDDLHPNNEGYRLMGERFSSAFLRPNLLNEDGLQITPRSGTTKRQFEMAQFANQ